MGKKSQGNAYDSYTYPYAGGGGPSMSVVPYRSSESAPLLTGNTQRERSSISLSRLIGGLFLALIISPLVYQTYVHGYCPPDPATRDLIRLQWEGEKAQHELEQEDWKWKRQDQAEKEKGWKRNEVRHVEEVTQRIRDERDRQKRIREEWDHEIEDHRREFEEMRARERREMELERERWRREVKERDQREEEERQRRHMYWGNVEAHTCTTYATREYTAQLMNLPRDWKHRLDACKATPLEIHGISHLPTTCKDEGPGVVIGRWEIDQLEPDCTTSWDLYNDKGCTSPGSGKKYVTHKLMNIPEKSDWKEFCATTPITFDHMQFPGAQECFPAIWGVFGQWEIDDSNC